MQVEVRPPSESGPKLVIDLTQPGTVAAEPQIPEQKDYRSLGEDHSSSAHGSQLSKNLTRVPPTKRCHDWVLPGGGIANPKIISWRTARPSLPSGC